MSADPKILLRLEGMAGSRSLKVYKEHDGYKALSAAFAKKPAELIDLVKASGLRGRGGAGFPTGMKWSFVPKDAPKKYLLCNNDEGEPGTFKDRYILELAPHMLIEGMVIAGYAIGASKAYIYTRCEFYEEIEWMNAAIKEAYAAGYLGKNILGSGFDFDLDHYIGAGAYICGEETGLISSLEGKKGQPKLKPPFPAVSGYLACPTVVNNTETLAALPWIINHGAEAYKKIGTEKAPGTKLFCVSGPVKNPGVFEVPLGYKLMDLIEKEAGGLLDGVKLKGVIPGGASAPILRASECNDITLDYECLAKAGSMLGSGAVMVIPEGQCMVELLQILTDFFHHESCGQCTPCREGTGWLSNIMRGIKHGEGSSSDIQRIRAITQHMGGKTICALSDACAMPVRAIIEKYTDEVEAYIARGGKKSHDH